MSTLWTFKDQIDTLLDFIGSDTSGAGRRHAKAAAMDAYREMANYHPWSFYRYEDAIRTEESYDTGTITYDHSGGAYDRLLSLSGGTFPDWTRNGDILIGSGVYEVAEVISSTALTLASNSNPGDDVASGTSYKLFRDTYPIPVGVSQVDILNASAAYWNLRAVDPREFMLQRQVTYSPGEPYCFTLMGDPNYQGTVCIRFQPPPANEVRYPFLARRQPRPLQIDEYPNSSASRMTVTATDDSTTVTGTNTAFRDAFVGSCIRFSRDSTQPTGEFGDNPTDLERIIMEVTNGTTLVLDRALTENVSNVAFVISDPVDIELHTMLSAYKRGCEKWLAHYRHRDDIQSITAMWLSAIIEAQGLDNQRFMGTRVATGPYRNGFYGRATMGDDVS